ncbi:MAG: bifunctional N-acetylglucosamine-1-phosphate uridyltransferase/glucosamine-1-phosphate acetyltransferase [Planctomycetes bacterium]|nr:bifunctional N-acetylglucosamine-1-phosphate uridyltransferase/glucosamine-1-phosphate acetyltransferase [Planctomycetota bacterium]
MSRPLAVICLCAGLGKRTKVSVPKVLLPLCGRTLAASALAATAPLRPTHTVVVLHHQKEKVQKAIQDACAGWFENLTFVDQGEPKGTGHAVQAGMQALAGFDGDVLVTYGDCPLITTATLQRLCELRGQAPCSVLTAFPDDPAELGRILRDGDGRFAGIREHKDCSAAQRAIGEINAGFYCFAGAALRPALANLRPNNAQGEYYLTDVVEGFARAGQPVPTLATEDATEIQGVNSLADLAAAREIVQERILLEHLGNGVVVVDPASTWIDHDVRIGADTRILPCCVIAAGCTIGSHCEVGPFAHLRAGTVLEDGAEIGNFVEAKKTRLGKGAKAKHLTYLGDATVGAKANIGAGTITANYDGVHKHETHIGERCFVGSGTVIVAPSRLGDRSMTGAGAILKRGSTVGADEVWVGLPAKFLKRRELPPENRPPENRPPEKKQEGT